METNVWYHVDTNGNKELVAVLIEAARSAGFSIGWAALGNSIKDISFESDFYVAFQYSSKFIGYNSKPRNLVYPKEKLLSFQDALKMLHTHNIM